MMSFFRKVKGSVSLILIFIMFPMLTQATLLVDASRINSAKTAVSGAGDLAMNAALSSYDRALQDIYGLFAVSKDMGELQDTFEAYFGNTLSGMLSGSDSVTQDYIDQLTTGVVDGLFGSENISEEDMMNHLAMETISLTMEGNSASTLANPAVMKTQIVEYMKYKAPLMFTTSILDQMNALADSKSQSEAVQAQVEYTQSLDTLQDACNAAKKSIDTYNGNVITLNSDAGSINNIDTMFADGGTVKSNLKNATYELLYYRSIYDTYWGGEKAIYDYSAVEAELNKQPAPVSYSLETTSSTYSGKVISSTGSVEGDLIGFPLDLLNKEMALDNTGTNKILVKDSVHSDGYEDIFALERVLEKAGDEYDAYSTPLSNVNTDLGKVTGTGLVYIQSYHSNIAAKYTAADLAVILTKLRNYNAAYSAFDGKLNSLKTHVVDESDEMLPYILVDSTTKQTLESTDNLSHDQLIRLEAFKADYAILENYVNIPSNINYTVTENEDGTKIYDFELENSSFTSKSRTTDLKRSVGKDFSGDLSYAISQCATYREGWKDKANEYFAAAWSAINDYKEQLKTVKGNIDTVVSNLGVVREKAEDVNGKLGNWGTKIQSTPDGATKDTMETQHSSEQEKVVLGEIDELKNFAIAQQSAYAALISKLEAITYFGEKVYAGQLDPNTFVPGLTGGIWRNNSTYNSRTAMGIDEINDNEVASLMNDFYQPSDGGITDEIKSKVSVAQGQNFVQFGYGADSTAADAKNHLCEIYFALDYPESDEALALKFYKKLLTSTKEAEGKQANNGSDAKSKFKEQMPKESESVNENSFKQNASTETNTNKNKLPDIGASYTAIKTKAGTTVGKMPTAEGQASSGGANDIDKVSGDGDNKSKAGDYKSQMAASSNFLGNLTSIVESFIKNPANAAINYMYVEEYFRTMFSCQTTNVGDEYKTDKEATLEGIIFSPENNAYYQMEQEYIIFGDNNSPGESVVQCYMTIFGIRFVLNAIYAFTSSEIQTIACQLATAIAGWTVFGVPIVQAIITMVFALAESGLDLLDLKKGDSVPIYKTASTWKCSISGIVRETVKTAANEAIEYSAEKASQFITDVANGAIENIGDSANDFINSQVDSAVSSVKSKLFAATTGAAMEIYSVYGEEIKNTTGDAQKELKTKIKAYLTDSINSCAEGTPVESAVKEGMNYVESNIDSFVDSVASTITGAVDSGEGYIASMQTAVSNKIDSFVKANITSKITDKIDKLSEKLTTAVEDTVNAKTDELKAKATESVQNALDEYLGEAGDTVTENLNVDSKDTKGTICMNYKQYLQIFMLIGIAADQNGMLNRCAAVIESNMNYMPKSDICPYKTDGYSLKIPSSYTLVNARADVKINTIFSYSASTTGGMAESEGLYSNLAPLWGSNGTSTLSYYSVMGY